MLSNSIQCSLNDHFVTNICPDFLGIQDESTLSLEEKKKKMMRRPSHKEIIDAQGNKMEKIFSQQLVQEFLLREFLSEELSSCMSFSSPIVSIRKRGGGE